MQLSVCLVLKLLFPGFAAFCLFIKATASPASLKRNKRKEEVMCLWKSYYSSFYKLAKAVRISFMGHYEYMKESCFNVFEQKVVYLRLTFNADYCMILWEIHLFLLLLLLSVSFQCKAKSISSMKSFNLVSLHSSQFSSMLLSYDICYIQQHYR